MGFWNVACLSILSLFLVACGDSQSTSSSLTSVSGESQVSSEQHETRASEENVSAPERSMDHTSNRPQPDEATLLESSEFGIAAELAKTHQPRNAIEKARNSTVFIDTGFGSGSGFFVDEICTVVTNRHVVQLTYSDMKKMERRRVEVRRYLDMGIADREQRRALSEELEKLDVAVLAYKSSGTAKAISVSLVNGRKLPAKIKAISREWDLAYLHLPESGCDPFVVGESEDLPLGHKVYTIGNPAGMKYSVTSGIISGYQEHEKQNFIQTDAAINGGNSGGPLIDSEGHLLGVNTWVLTNTEGIGFSIPAHRMLEDMEKQAGKMSDALASAEFELWDPESTTSVEEEKKRLGSMIQNALEECVAEYDEQQWRVALDECRFAAEHDEPQAQYLLSMILYDKDDEKKLKESLQLLKDSAQKGYAEAIYAMAVFHEKGKHVPKNIAVANDMYEEACEKKLPWACNSLAVENLKRYETEGVKQKLEAAIDSGSVAAIYNLGYMYDTGLGVNKDLIRADQLFEKAAMLGNNMAQYRMFWKNYKGRNQKKDYMKAYAWLLVSETYNKEKADVLDGWDSDIPADTRFFLKRLLGNSQLTMAHAEANKLKKIIAMDAEKHKKENLYRRKASSEAG